MGVHRVVTMPFRFPRQKIGDDGPMGDIGTGFPFPRIVKQLPHLRKMTAVSGDGFGSMGRVGPPMSANSLLECRSRCLCEAGASPEEVVW